MNNANWLSGYKTLLTTIGGAGGLALADIPDKLIWPVTAVLVAAVIVFGIQGIAKEMRRK